MKRLVKIVCINRAFPLWIWLCSPCLLARKEDGYTVEKIKPAPHKLKCDDCGHISIE
jgi:hypothetical protein